MADDTKFSDETSSFIDSIDKKIGTKYGIGLRTVLTDTSFLKARSNPKEIIENMKTDVSNYFDSLSKGMEDEEAAFDSKLKAVDTLYKRLNDVVKNKSSFANVPFTKPLNIERETDKEENLTIDQYDGTVDALVTKLVSVSHYVADISIQYKDYNLGSWLFSGKIRRASCRQTV